MEKSIWVEGLACTTVLTVNETPWRDAATNTFMEVAVRRTLALKDSWETNMKWLKDAFRNDEETRQGLDETLMVQKFKTV